MHVHDFHATMLHLLGIDHERLTYLYQGRRFRLTDVHGKVVKDCWPEGVRHGSDTGQTRVRHGSDPCLTRV